MRVLGEQEEENFELEEDIHEINNQLKEITVL